MNASATRRDFLQAASTGIALAAASTGSSVRAAQSASEKIVVGLIGCGGRGTHDAGLFQKTPNVEVAYVCDVDDSRRVTATEQIVGDDEANSLVRRQYREHWGTPAGV